uniref:NADH dehydrogenase subunit 4l n=1 Tax=Paramoeba aparasomata TaxID=2583407 RepID=A0A5P8HBA8_9EUKA|nr:NADH dehydrogenase subunit 4l [Paramoeba aparasomata]
MFSIFLNYDNFFLNNLISVSSYKYINLFVIIFIIGCLGIFVTRQNIIIIIMSIELLLLSVNLIFIFLSLNMDDLIGQMFALYVLTVAAAESSIGLALVVVYYRLRGQIAIDYISTIKG